MKNTAVVVMARSPYSKQSPKTRLTPEITSEADRRHLYTAFLRDVLHSARQLEGVALRVAYTQDGGPAGFEELGLVNKELLPQKGQTLGEREQGVFTDLFMEGFSKVLMIGSDIPTLPTEHLALAIELLAEQTVVIGPSRDGGYYLIGLVKPTRGPTPDLFTKIRWSTQFAFSDTVTAARQARIRVALVPPWYDVDNKDGLTTLIRELANANHKAPNTSLALTEIFKNGYQEQRDTSKR